MQEAPDLIGIIFKESQVAGMESKLTEILKIYIQDLLRRGWFWERLSVDPKLILATWQ